MAGPVVVGLVVGALSAPGPAVAGPSRAPKPVRKVFDKPGTGIVFNVPAGVTTITVELVGGGGAGGAGLAATSDSTTAWGGNGGGGGASVRCRFPAPPRDEKTGKYPLLVKVGSGGYGFTDDDGGLAGESSIGNTAVGPQRMTFRAKAQGGYGGQSAAHRGQPPRLPATNKGGQVARCITSSSGRSDDAGDPAATLATAAGGDGSPGTSGAGNKAGLGGAGGQAVNVPDGCPKGRTGLGSHGGKGNWVGNTARAKAANGHNGCVVVTYTPGQ
ncbi:hypothetical protein [Streptomyces sp. NPDC037389]|uniref:glycine-rich domain-containing protein n=1 Tax=Streptomyces sp. NPDC037389 TaxID=3155369 RepID=UPI0033DD5E87